MSKIVHAAMWKNTSSCWGSYWTTKPVKQNYSMTPDEPTTGYFVKLKPEGGVDERYEGSFSTKDDAEEFLKLYEESL